MVAAMSSAKTYEELRDACRALDRIVMFGHYQVPQLYAPWYSVSYWNKFGIPKTYPEVLHDRRIQRLAGLGGDGLVEQGCGGDDEPGLASAEILMRLPAC